MHEIEPFYNWRHLYISEEDSMSPFYGREYSDIYFTHTVYNYYIHPQWDDFGSNTLYLKIIFADYRSRTAIIEFIGEWNDLLYNDIMFLKRNVIEPLIENGIAQFILIGENVLNFHASETDYYEEWVEELDEGWIVCVGFLPHVVQDLRKARMGKLMVIDDEINQLPWRTYLPDNLILKIVSMM